MKGAKRKTETATAMAITRITRITHRSTARARRAHLGVMPARTAFALAAATCSAAGAPLGPLDSPIARIVGGDDVDLMRGGYGWVVQIEVEKKSSYSQCGGSLIASDWVLTAAHCFDSYVKKRPGKVVLGESANCFDYPERCKGATERKIADVFKHPDYNPKSNIHDIALLRLDSTAGSRFKPVRYSKVGLPADTSFDKADVASVLGWGRAAEGGDSPDTFQKGVVRLVSGRDCSRGYGYKAGAIKDQMICAIAPGVDSCTGDSGGPLFDERAKTVIGVISWGKGCARDNFPGVYIDVGFYTNWIAQTTGGGGGGDGSNQCTAVWMKYGSCSGNSHVKSKDACLKLADKLLGKSGVKVKTVAKANDVKGCYVNKKGKVIFNSSGKELPTNAKKRSICCKN